MYLFRFETGGNDNISDFFLLWRRLAYIHTKLVETKLIVELCLKRPKLNVKTIKHQDLLILVLLIVFRNYTQNSHILFSNAV